MSEYNYGIPIQVENISSEKIREAIHEWSEGSDVLEKSLITAYENGLETTACCRGYHEIEDVQTFYNDFLNKKIDVLALGRLMCDPYIVFSKDSHIFGYLSRKFIENPNVILHNGDYNDTIFLYGDKPDALMSSLTAEIKSGKKLDNKDALLKKIDVNGSPELYYQSFVFAMKNSGFSEEQIDNFKQIIILNAFTRCNRDYYNDFDNFCDSHGLSGSLKEGIKNYLQNKGYFTFQETK